MLSVDKVNGAIIPLPQMPQIRNFVILNIEINKAAPIIMIIAIIGRLNNSGLSVSIYAPEKLLYDLRSVRR
jgi:hypothetical protein